MKHSFADTGVPKYNLGTRQTYRYTLFALCCALIGATASAQETTAAPTPPPLPPGPLIQTRAPDMAKWVITTTHTASGANSTSAPTADASADNEPQTAGKPKVVLEVTMTKTGKLMLREVRTQDGRVIPSWCVGDLQITIFGDSSIVQAKLNSLDQTVSTPNYEDYSDSDFPGFDWITLSNYTGIKEFGGKKCIVFQETNKNDTGPGVNLSAYVDFATRLPVALTGPAETRTYVFKAPPATELVLPPRVVQLLSNRQKVMDSATPRSQMQ